MVTPPAYPIPRPAARARSAKTKIAIAAGAGALGLALIAMLVLAIGGGTGGGKATAEDLVRAAIERASAGDGDGLFALAGTDHLFGVAMRCDTPHARAQRDETIRTTREHLLRHLDGWRGLSVTVRSVEPTGDADVVRPGAKGETGCTTTTTMSIQQLHAAVTVAGDGGDESHSDLTFQAEEVDGLWYLDEMPGPPAIGGLAELRRVKAAMCACTDAGCVQRVEQDFSRFSDGLTADDTTTFSDEQATIVHELMDCEIKAMH